MAEIFGHVLNPAHLENPAIALGRRCRRHIWHTLVEMINGPFKSEVIWRPKSWPGASVLKMAILSWVDWFYNLHLLGPIDHIPPAEAKANYYPAFGTSAWLHGSNKTYSAKPVTLQIHWPDAPLPSGYLFR